ncbi:hypothetical protein WN944_019637 [Citrus x changshan-huyou]|uniref:Uncharacterized protein n=1 Tax=Citrus x changshan-huyou TaxID=2935761 RepID=A0AAP0LWK6_9ROSI
MIPTVKEFKGDIVIPTYNGESWKDFKFEKGSSRAVLGLEAVELGAFYGARMQRVA